MTFKRIDHIGIAVENLEQAIETYTRLLGKGPDHLEEVDEQKVKTAFFPIDDTHLELLQSTSPQGPIGQFIAKNGRGGIHHLCVEVDDIEATLKRYKENNIPLIDQEPRTGAHGMRIAFVHPKATGGVLLELAQKK